MTDLPVFEVSGLRCELGGRVLFSDFSLSLNRGEIVAVIGPNGVGKTTALRLISGISHANSECTGSIRFMGEDFLKLTSFERAKRLVYLASELRANFPISARELVQLGRIDSQHTLLGDMSPQDQKRVNWAMETAGCLGLQERDYLTLSGGEKQLVCFARALAQEAKVVLLDESFSRLDLHHQARIGGVLKKLSREGYTFAIVSHDLNFVLEFCDRCLIWPMGTSPVIGPVGTVISEEAIRSLYPSAKIFKGSNPRTGAPKIFFEH